MDIINIILHLDQYIIYVVNTYHMYFYFIFFIVIFCETGLIITPFLPGDSLLFVAGSLAATGQLNFYLLALVIFTAAFMGDNCNFCIGKYLGEHLFKNPNSKIFRQDFLNKTHAFYEKHGRNTIIIARLVPVIRSFAPFVAGIGGMHYLKFISFSIIGSTVWILIFLGGGFLFGNIPLIKNHLSLVILIVIIISVIPVIKMIINEIKLPKFKKSI